MQNVNAQSQNVIRIGAHYNYGAMENYWHSIGRNRYFRNYHEANAFGFFTEVVRGKFIPAVELYMQTSSVTFRDHYRYMYEASVHSRRYKERGIDYNYEESFSRIGILPKINVVFGPPLKKLHVIAGMGLGFERTIKYVVKSDVYHSWDKSYQSSEVNQGTTYVTDIVPEILETNTSYFHLTHQQFTGVVNPFWKMRYAFIQNMAVSLECGLKQYFNSYLSEFSEGKIRRIWYGGFQLDYTFPSKMRSEK